MSRLTTAGRNINVNIDTLDTKSEVTLGLVSACCVTCLLLVVIMPIWTLFGMSWVRSWEAMAVYNTTSTTTTLPPGFYGPLSSEDLEDRVTAKHGSLEDGFDAVAKSEGARPILADGGQDGGSKNVRGSVGGANTTGSDGSKDGDDNTISREEMADGLSELDPPVDRQQADRVFDKMDSDKNDKVDKKEFLGAFAAGFLIPGGGPTTTTTTRRTTSTTTFATVTTTTTTARKADMSLVEFRTKMRQWSGVPTNKAGCEKLDLMGDGTISLDEFVPAAQIIAEVSEADAQLLFNEMDANGDGSVSMNECIISGPWMKRQISSMGDAAIVLKTYDFDGSGDLSETEFATLCSLTDPPVSAKRQPALFAELDTNENGKLEVDELREDTTTTTTTTVLPNHAGQEIGAEELSKYIGIPAVVTGSSRFSFVADKNIPVPPMDTLPDLVSPVFLKIFGPSMGIEANFQSQAASFIDADDTSLVPGTSQAVKVQVSWEAKVEDGGQFQIDLTNKGAKIHDDILAELKASQVHFISQSKRCFWTQATSAYYGMALVRVTRGTNLEQQFGYGCVDDLTDQSGSPPFDLP